MEALPVALVGALAVADGNDETDASLEDVVVLSASLVAFPPLSPFPFKLMLMVDLAFDAPYAAAFDLPPELEVSLAAKEEDEDAPVPDLADFDDDDVAGGLACVGAAWTIRCAV